MIKKIIYTTLFIFFITNVYSQRWSRYKYEFYYGIGATNFMADIGAPNPLIAPPITQYVWVNFWNTIGFTGNAGLRYNIKDRQYVRASLFLGQLYAKDPRDEPNYWITRGETVNSFFTEISVKYEYVIWKEKKKTTVYRKLGESSFKNFSLPTYLFVGVGGTFNVGKWTKIVNEGQDVFYENFTNIAPVIPFGIGFKYRIDRLTYINLEASWHFALSDGLDNAVGTPENKYGEWYDQYQTITFNIVHKLRQNQNGTPKFRRR